ncbi:MAG: DUF4373 domain-containing protein [Ruminococcaceae bacterium]|nr:DUF4373 domain-containing protein [Oscillospiraceae bacterium]
MGRPLSDGLPYIGLPTNWFRLPENRILRAKLGDKALLIWTDLYLSCFEINGYYKAVTEDDVAVLADEHKCSENFIGQVMHFLAQRSLVDATLLHSDKVVTSRDIQLTFQEAVKSRGKTREIEVREGYWLLSKKETRPFIKLCSEKDFFGKNGGYCGKNGSYCGKNEGFFSRKEKKGKERKRKENTRLTAAKYPTGAEFQELSQKGKRLAKYPVGLKPGRRYKSQSISQRGEAIRRLYEEICGGVLSPQPKVTDKQLDLIRMGTLGGYRMADYRAVFEAVGESSFLRGSNGKWRATFEWFITPEKMKKVLDGRYRDYARQKYPAKSGAKDAERNGSFDTDEFFEAALAVSYRNMGYSEDESKRLAAMSGALGN